MMEERCVGQEGGGEVPETGIRLQDHGDDKDTRAGVVGVDSEGKTSPLVSTVSKVFTVSDVERIEMVLGTKIDALASVLEEQLGLLRQLVAATRPAVTARGDRDADGGGTGISTGTGTSTGTSHVDADGQTPTPRDCNNRNNHRQHPGPSRLQKMSKASESIEDDVDVERRKAMSRQATLPTQAPSQSREMTLEQRKRDFVMKTAPGAHGAEKSPGSTARPPKSSTKTRLAVAAARREMERSRERRAQQTKLEREHANSVGSWVTFVLVIILGGTALLLGMIGYAETSRSKAAGAKVLPTEL